MYELEVIVHLDAGEFGVVWGPGVELFPLKCKIVIHPFPVSISYQTPFPEHQCHSKTSLLPLYHL